MSPTIHDPNIWHSFLLEPSVSKRRCDTCGMNISWEYLHNTQRNCNKKTVLDISCRQSSKIIHSPDFHNESVAKKNILKVLCQQNLEIYFVYSARLGLWRRLILALPKFFNRSKVIDTLPTELEITLPVAFWICLTRCFVSKEPIKITRVTELIVVDTTNVFKERICLIFRANKYTF